MTFYGATSEDNVVKMTIFFFSERSKVGMGTIIVGVSWISVLQRKASVILNDVIC